MTDAPPAQRRFAWLLCHACGWEHRIAAMVNQCPQCGQGRTIHIHSNADGERPKILAMECDANDPVHHD